MWTGVCLDLTLQLPSLALIVRTVDHLALKFRYFPKHLFISILYFELFVLSCECEYIILVVLEVLELSSFVFQCLLLVIVSARLVL